MSTVSPERVRWVAALALLVSCGQSEPLFSQDQSSCSPVWNPAWQQTDSNEWWAEFTISGDVAQSAWLDIGGRQVPLSNQWGKWAGSLPGISATTPVVLYARNDLRQLAQTLPFHYMVTTQP